MALTCKENYFDSTSKADIKTRYLVWTDDSVKKPIGVVQLTHGWGEHIDRYEELAGILTAAGYVVCGQDHIGHGKTSGVKAQQIYPADTKKAMVEDMHELYKIMHDKYPKLPYFLYGHSMGSMLVRLYLPKYNRDLTAAIICGTVPMPAVASLVSPALNIAGKVLSGSYAKEKAKAEKKNAKLTEEMSDRKPTFLDMTINSWLSYDKANIVNYVQDPYDGATINPTSLFMLSMMTKVTPFRWAKKIEKELPIFVISGEADLAGAYTVGPKQVNRLLTKAGRNVTMKLYPHAKHEIHNEAESGVKDEVFADILNFINAANPKVK